MSKPLGRFHKLIFAINTVAAVLLLVSFITPFVNPERFPLFSALSLAVSPLLVINALFALYWLVRLNRRVWLSALLLIVGFFEFNGFIKFSSSDSETAANELSVLSFNVQLFEAYNDNPDNQAAQKMNQLVDKQRPDVLFIQEYYKQDSLALSAYPYSFVHFKEDYTMGHAIFSKYPLINTGAFDFTKTSNNTLYADLLVGNDTIRLYNLHLQSYRIAPSVSEIQSRGTEFLTKRLKKAFRIQQRQLDTILKHKNQTEHPVIIAGDLNNTAFSYVYRELQRDFVDAFAAKGSGLGATFKVEFYPIRIDYIFVDPQLRVLNYNTCKAGFSDHKPITATVGWD